MVSISKEMEGGRKKCPSPKPARTTCWLPTTCPAHGQTNSQFCLLRQQKLLAFSLHRSPLPTWYHIYTAESAYLVFSSPPITPRCLLLLNLVCYPFSLHEHSPHRLSAKLLLLKQCHLTDSIKSTIGGTLLAHSWQVSLLFWHILLVLTSYVYQSHGPTPHPIPHILYLLLSVPLFSPPQASIQHLLSHLGAL